tara:strand:- start:681 stop:857 length:177 start_codon:yes stop_codon:yes gene_type:complete
METKKGALSVDVRCWSLLDGVEVHNLLSDHGIKNVLKDRKLVDGTGLIWVLVILLLVL